MIEVAEAAAADSSSGWRRQMADGSVMEVAEMAGNGGQRVTGATAGGDQQAALEGAASGTARDGYLCVC